MHFSDGLPINLIHGIAPKPKPPLPLFSTIPKKGRQKITSLTQQPSNDANNSTSIDDMTVFSSATKMTRNLSIPTDALMNTVGLMGSSPIKEPQTSSSLSGAALNNSSDILKFRSIKSPSKINKIKDGMRSLRKSKSKSKDENAITVQNVEELSPTLTNIKFTSDLKPVVHAPTPASTYDVPVSNMTVAVEINTCPMYNENANEENGKNNVSCLNSSEIDNNNSVPHTDEDDYLTANDSGSFNSNDKDSEEIYFIDAPTKEKVTAELVRSTSIKYTPFKNVPYFPDGTMIPQPNSSNGNESTTENNANNNNNNRFERLDSNISQISIDSSIFGHRLSTAALDSSTVRTSSPSSLARRIHNKPNYFIPIDQLALHEILGEGEFGSVYRGTVAIGEDDNGHAENKVPVAIKTLRDEHCKQNQADFLREASVMIKLSHHCIVKLIGISRVSTIII